MNKTTHRWLVALVPVALAGLYALQQAVSDGGLDQVDACVIALAMGNTLIVAVINIVRMLEDPAATPTP